MFTQKSKSLTLGYMAPSENQKREAARRVGRFGLVGVINTLIDYAVFIGVTKALSLPLSRVWIAKLVSGAVAMACSYLMNHRWVFQPESGGHLRRAARFAAVTAVGSFGIQLGLVQLFSSVVPQPGEWFFHALGALSITNLAPSMFTLPFAIKTAAFVLATLASLTWNYLAYRRVVFV